MRALSLWPESINIHHDNILIRLLFKRKVSYDYLIEVVVNILKVMIFDKFRKINYLFLEFVVVIHIELDHVKATFHTIIIVVKHLILIIIVKLNENLLHFHEVNKLYLMHELISKV